MQEPIPAHERAAILDRVAALSSERADETARTISAEAGKPMKAARVEAARAVSTFTMAAVEARKLAGRRRPDGRVARRRRASSRSRSAYRSASSARSRRSTSRSTSSRTRSRRRSPQAAPSSSSPQSQTPLSALLLAELETEAGLPAGWLNVVCGPAAEIGDVLVEDERVKLITFTGSAPVGWKLRERAARKRVNLELGNATPVIVAADADLEDAATRLAANAFSFAGQSCISVQRIYVERAAYDAFLERFLPRVEALEVGDPADEETDVGPLISESDRDRVLSWIEEAKSRRRASSCGWRARRRAAPTDRDRRRAHGREGVVRGGLRAALHGHALRHPRRGDRARQRHALRAPGRGFSRAT